MKTSGAGSLFAGARVDGAAPLAPLTTLRVGPIARRLITCASTEQVIAVLRQLDSETQATPVLVFAGGSNLVIADTLTDLTAVRLANKGVTVDGNPGVEQYSENGMQGELLVLVGKRYVVKVASNRMPPEFLRTVYGTIDTKKLAALK